MPYKNALKNSVVVPDGMSEDADTSESEEELNDARNILKSQVVTSHSSSSSEASDTEDGLQQVTSKSKRKKKKRLHWVKKSFQPPIGTFLGNLPARPTIDDLKPIDYFYSLFSEESFTILKDQSNLYSVQVNPNRLANISDTEISQMIGVLIMTGVYSFPQQRFYWTNGTCVESIASVMSRDRFLQIKKFLHVVDNSTQLNQEDPNYDRAFKVRPLLNIVKNNFRKIPKEEHLCVDEQIIPFKGKGVMKQHMRKKPDHWGYKMFLLAGGASGVCYDFIFYTGKTNKPEHGFCTDIVFKLCETVLHMVNHKLYFDNYFTTIPLQMRLKKLGIFATGTVRSNRLPDLVMKDEKKLKEEGRGSMNHRVVQNDDVVLCATRWYDNNVVNCLSTLHGCESTDLVKRWSTSQKNI